MAVDSCFWIVQAEYFQENIFGGVILVYNRHPLWTVSLQFDQKKDCTTGISSKIFENGWLWTAASE